LRVRDPPTHINRKTTPFAGANILGRPQSILVYRVIRIGLETQAGGFPGALEVQKMFYHCDVVPVDGPNFVTALYILIKIY